MKSYVKINAVLNCLEAGLGHERCEYFKPVQTGRPVSHFSVCEHASQERIFEDDLFTIVCTCEEARLNDAMEDL